MASPNATKVHRVGMVIGLRDEAVEAYRRLHADDEPGVRDLLRRYHPATSRSSSSGSPTGGSTSSPTTSTPATTSSPTSPR